MILCDKCGCKIEFENNFAELCPEVPEFNSETEFPPFNKYHFCDICVVEVQRFIEDYISESEVEEVEFNIDDADDFDVDKGDVINIGDFVEKKYKN